MSQPGPWPGTTPPSYDTGYRPVHRSGSGTASLVLGVIALMSSLFCIGIGFGIAAVVAGIMARSQARRAGVRSPGAAQVGIVLGVVSIVVGLAVVGLFAWVFIEGARTGCLPTNSPIDWVTTGPKGCF